MDVNETISRRYYEYKADYEDFAERCVYIGNTVYLIHRDIYDGGLRLDSIKYNTV